MSSKIREVVNELLATTPDAQLDLVVTLLERLALLTTRCADEEALASNLRALAATPSLEALDVALTGMGV